MVGSSLGLVDVATDDLRIALRAVYRGDAGCPLGVADLARVGLQHCAESLLGHLRGLDRLAVQAVLVAVLAERGVGAEKISQKNFVAGSTHRLH